MIQEFLIISPRGDTLLTKNYAGSVVRRPSPARQPPCGAPARTFVRGMREYSISCVLQSCLLSTGPRAGT
jgi:hypothetical protein